MAEALGEFLRDLRTSRCISRNALAAEAGIAKSTLSRWEAGYFRPRLPELEAVLRALGATRHQRGRALALVDAPRAVVRLEQGSANTTCGAILGTRPCGGSLLRAMRQRRGRTLFDLARAVGVTTSTVSRWERGEMWPSAGHLHALCHLLEAREEELVALTTGGTGAMLGPSALDGEDSAAVSPDQINQQLWLLVFGPSSPTQVALMDLSYLRLEAQAWRLARRCESAHGLLAAVYTWHANQLWTEQRLAAAVQKADQALDILWGQEQIDDFGFVAAIRSAQVTAQDGTRAGSSRGFDTLRRWLPRAQEAGASAHAAWMMSSMALYVSQQARGSGQAEGAIALAARACETARRAQNPEEFLFRQRDQGTVLLRCGRPQDTLEMLDRATEQRDKRFDFDVALLRAESLLLLKDVAQAHKELQRAYLTLETCRPTQANLEVRRRRQLDAVARRF